MENINLNNARQAKNDEFYTSLSDVEQEMNAYLSHNPELFKDKTVLLPCDDPTWSSFTKYFIDNFHTLGLKKLISTCFAANEQSSAHESQTSLFDSVLHEKKTDFNHGKILVVEKSSVNNVGSADNTHTENSAGKVHEYTWNYLKGDGDFRSKEISSLRDEADFVITNPPFSLFREFVSWLDDSNVQYAIIGSINACSYKELFPLIKENKVWLGFNSPMKFKSPDSEEYKKVACWWYTNIEHNLKREPLILMNKKDNERFNKKVYENKNAYKKYDNYDAIEVPSTLAIPSDYEGIMGVPISFLTKYDPKQFEILGTQRWAKSQALLDVYTGKCYPPEKDNRTTINGKETYDRIFIRHLNLKK